MFRKRKRRKEKEKKIQELRESLKADKKAMKYLNEQVKSLKSNIEDKSSIAKVKRLLFSDIEALKFRIRIKERELGSLEAE